MYRFTAAADVNVCLHSEAGDLLGYASFRNGVWETPEAEKAEALRRALPACGEWRVVEVALAPQEGAPAEPPTPEPDPGNVAISPHAEEPPDALQATRRRRHQPSASEGES